jgi:adenosine kinase
MSLLITGSIATDHLMSFPGKFSDSLVVDQLDKLSVSFLVDDLEVRRGGCAANICFGLGNLGLEPVLVGAVGEDFVEYRAWLERHHVDCDSVHVSPTRHTARFVCTNDSSHAQIASFYAGAMSEAREIELKPIADRAGAPDYVLVGPNDPEAMLRHTDECRQRGYRFVADPSQQLAFSDGELIRPLIDGADILFSNEYEAALITQKTGWSDDEVLSRVGTWVVTLGAAGVRIDRKGEDSITVSAVPEIRKVEPTGVGDAFRAGFLAALSWGLDSERAAQLGCLLAVYVVEQVGTQEYTLSRAAFLERCRATYGDQAVADIEPHLRTIRP